ncbi:hypothetical protein ACROYT_G032394 [Oculina patagonica]
MALKSKFPDVPIPENMSWPEFVYQDFDKYGDRTAIVTMAPIVPPIVLFLAKHPLVDKYDLSTVEEVTCGAAPMGKGLEEALIKRMPQVKYIRQDLDLHAGRDIYPPLNILLEQRTHLVIWIFKFTPEIWRFEKMKLKKIIIVATLILPCQILSTPLLVTPTQRKLPFQTRYYRNMCLFRRFSLKLLL